MNDQLVFITSIDDFETKMKEIPETVDVQNGASCTGTKYFVSPNGNDLDLGTSSHTAWKTVQKVNSVELQAGDCVCFHCGGTFKGHLNIVEGVTYCAYGKGPKPKIVGLSFKNVGDRIHYVPEKHVTDQGVEYNLMILEDEDTCRTYLGRYCLMPDNSGIVCVKRNRSMFFYDFKSQELVHLGKTSWEGNIYVHPITGLVYYTGRSSENCHELWSIHPRTLESKLIYTAENDRMHIGVEVTNDARYTYYTIDMKQLPDNVEMEFGRIDLKEGRIDRVVKHGYPISNCTNHFILNPEHPEILLFHHERIIEQHLNDRMNVINLDTNVITTYAQRGQEAFHATWTRDGERVCFGDNGVRGTCFVDKSLQNLTFVPSPNRHWCGNHEMISYDNKWIISDGAGHIASLVVVNVATQEDFLISTDICHGFKSRHPYHPHPEISNDGSIIVWNETRERIRGVAWTENMLMKK